MIDRRTWAVGFLGVLLGAAATRPADWGEAVEGVQASLKVENGRAKASALAFVATIKNGGKRDDLFVVRGQEFLEIEVDGRWYHWVGDQSGQAVALPPGKQLGDVRVSLVGEWGPLGHDVKLKPAKGKHSLRVTFVAENEQEFEPVLRVVSNKVEFEVVE